MDWQSLQCEVEGVLDRVDRVTQFTGFNVSATLTVDADVDEARALKLLQKAENACLITNSLKADSHLDARIQKVG